MEKTNDREEMKMSQDDGLDALIARKLRRLLWHMVFKAICCLACLAMAGVFLLSPLINVANPDPSWMNEKQYGEEGETTESLLFLMLDAWITSQYPYCELDYVNVEKKGFAQHGIKAHVFDLRDAVDVGGSTNRQYQMSFGNLREVMNTMRFLPSYSFSRTASEGSVSKDREAIKQLPESTWLCVAASAKKRKRSYAFRILQARTFLSIGRKYMMESVPQVWESICIRCTIGRK